MAQFVQQIWGKVSSCCGTPQDVEKKKLLAKEHLGDHASAFGEQSISTVSSFVLNINNIIGPAVVTLPGLLHQSGWMVPLIVLILMQIFSAFSATMISEAMQRIPGNQNFLRRFEFGTTMKHYFGKWPYIIGQIVLNICLQASNIASIVVAAQVMDDFLVYAFKSSYAFDFAHFKFLKSTGLATDDNPFGQHIWIISLGYVVAMAMCIPFGFLNLDENMWFQWFSFIGMMVSFAMFYILFILAGAGVINAADDSRVLHLTPTQIFNTSTDPPFSPAAPHAPFPVVYNNITWQPMRNVSDLSLRWNTDRVPLFGSFIGQANVIGTVIFMSAFVTSVPSWVNEKKPHVSINKSIWSSTLTSNLIKASFGYLAGITYRTSSSSNILNVISRHAPAGPLGVVTRIAVYLFNFATIIPGIPVISILVRYNLVTAKFCPPWVANMIGVVAPWVVSMFFYHGQGLSIVVNWSAILFQGFINFAVPALLYYFAIKLYPHFPDLVIEHLSDDDCFGPSHMPDAERTDNEDDMMEDGDTEGVRKRQIGGGRRDTKGGLLSINDGDSNSVTTPLITGSPSSSNFRKTKQKEFITPSLNHDSGYDSSSSKKHPVITINHSISHGVHDHGADGCVIHHTDLNKGFGAIVDDDLAHDGIGTSSASTTISSIDGVVLEEDGVSDSAKGAAKSLYPSLSSPASNSTIPSSKARKSEHADIARGSYGSFGGGSSDNSSDGDDENHEKNDIEFSHPQHTPGWFYANQDLKLRPIDALPRKLPNWWKMFIAMAIVGVMVAMTLTALTLDFYFLAKHQDIVDN